MTAVLRSPLTTRTLSLHFSPAPTAFSPNVQKPPSAKRARSPEPSAEGHAQSVKRAKAVEATNSTTAIVREEARRKKEAEKRERELDWREKYTRAFPKWRFYLDLGESHATSRDEFEAQINELGAVCITFTCYIRILLMSIFCSALNTSSLKRLRTL